MHTLGRRGVVGLGMSVAILAGGIFLRLHASRKSRAVALSVVPRPARLPGVPREKAPPLEIERARLREFEKEEIQRLVARFDDESSKNEGRPLAIYSLSELGTLDAERALIELYYRPLKTLPGDTWLERRRTIIQQLAQAGSAESAPVLERAARSGPIFPRWEAARGLARILGAQAVPTLHELAEDANRAGEGSIRNAVLVDMARLGDEDAFRELAAPLERSASTDDSMQAQINSLSRIGDARDRRARSQVFRILRDTNWAQSRLALALKLRAGWTALYLGDDAAVPLLIELVEPIGPAEVAHLGADTPAKILAMFTHQDFGRDAEAWRSWWNTEGSKEGVIDPSPPREEQTQIARAALDWARAAESGPALSGDVAYVVRHGLDPGIEDETLRLYAPAQMDLLRVRGVAVDTLAVNRQCATARLRETGFPHKSVYFDLELRREEGGWKVIRSTPRRLP